MTIKTRLGINKRHCLNGNAESVTRSTRKTKHIAKVAINNCSITITSTTNCLWLRTTLTYKFTSTSRRTTLTTHSLRMRKMMPNHRHQTNRKWTYTGYKIYWCEFSWLCDDILLFFTSISHFILSTAIFSKIEI
jgi:hypothetical protein